MVLLKFLNNFCAIRWGGGDGSCSSRSFLFLHCLWTSGSHTVGLCPSHLTLEPASPFLKSVHKELLCTSDPCLWRRGGDIGQPQTENNGRGRFHPTSPRAPISDFCSWVLTLPSSLGSHLSFCSTSLAFPAPSCWNGAMSSGAVLTTTLPSRGFSRLRMP